MIILLLLLEFFMIKFNYYYSKYKEIINYLIVGGLTTIVSIASYWVLRLFIDNYLICTIFSWVISVIFAYFTNRIFVFNSKNKKILIEFIKFVFCRGFTLLTEIVSMFLLVELLKVEDHISKIIVQFIIVILNYVLSKILVFKNKENE